MIQECKLRVTAQTVISQMLEGHKTFADLASKYEMTEEEFKKVVSFDNFIFLIEYVHHLIVVYLQLMVLSLINLLLFYF